MDQRIETLRSILTELGLSSTLNALSNETTSGFNPLMRSAPQGSQVRRIDLDPSRIRVEQLKRTSKDFDTTKSLTPEKGVPKSFNSFELTGFAPHPQHKLPEKGFAHLEFLPSMSTKSEDNAGKRPARFIQPKSNQMIPDPFEMGQSNSNRNVATFGAQRAPLHPALDKSDNSHEFSFGEETSNPASPISKSPLQKADTLNYATISKEQNPSPLIGSKMRIEDLYSITGAEVYVPGDSTGSKPVDRREQFASALSRAQKEISLIHKTGQSNTPFALSASDDFIMVYETSEAGLRALMEYLSTTKPFLFYRQNQPRVIGATPDLEQLKRTREETNTLKLDLRIFIDPSPPPGVVRNKYRIVKSLMESTFSNVFVCSNVINEKYFCMKKIKDDKMFYDQSLLEAAILFFLKKKGPCVKYNFLEVVEFFHFNNCLYIITEMLGASLYSAIIKPNIVITMREAQIILRDMLVCLKFLKSAGVIHCDIKPENILYRLDQSKGIKLIDFGSATFANDVDYDYLQTRPYRAPEITLGCYFDFAVDMWSLGCVMYEIVTNKVLFNYKTVQENMAKAMSLTGFTGLEQLASLSKKGRKSFVLGNALKVGEGNEFSVVIPKQECDISVDLKERNCDPHLIDFIKRCLVFDPAARLKVEDALNHEFARKNI